VQATVFTFDPATSAGTVVDDRGSTMPFGAAAFAAGGLRTLRPGQRVRLSLSDEHQVQAITVITLALPEDARRDRT